MTTQDIIKALNNKIELARRQHKNNRTREAYLVENGRLFTDDEDPLSFDEYRHLSGVDVQLEHIIVSLNNAIASLTYLDESLNL